MTKAPAIATAALFLACLAHSAQAQTEYAKIGWWKIGYTRSDDFSSCSASSRFKDETYFEMMLMQSETNPASNKVWVIYISNPKWGSWVGRKKNTG